jgi:hypothetical protein
MQHGAGLLICHGSGTAPVARRGTAVHLGRANTSNHSVSALLVIEAVNSSALEFQWVTADSHPGELLAQFFDITWLGRFGEPAVISCGRASLCELTAPQPGWQSSCAHTTAVHGTNS